MRTIRPARQDLWQALLGQWNITEMELWDSADLELLGTPHLTLDDRGHGAMRFLAIEANIDYRLTQREGLPAVEFSFEGHDEGDRISGRGWAVLQSNTLRGRLFIHDGDDSAFLARRRVTRRTSTR